MKKTILLSVLAALCLKFSVDAQDKPNITALKIGDQIPDITIKNIINYRSPDGKMKTSAKISDFKGRLLILDFWATWCSPCIAMLPRMDSLRRRFAGKVQFLPVNDQPVATVQAFLDKFHKLKRFDLPDVLQDTLLNKLFPHTYLPHYVWISKTGKVMAITEFREVTAANIAEALQGETLSLHVKSDALANPERQSTDTSLKGGKDTIIHRFTASYLEDEPSGWTISDDRDPSGKSIRATNVLMADLFNLALGEGKAYYGLNRTVYEVADTTVLTTRLSGDEALEWMRKGHVYSYEIQVPPSLKGLTYRIMQQDLEKNFPKYYVRIENRQITCLALVRTSDRDLLATKGGNSEAKFDGISGKLVNWSLQRLFAELSVHYMSNSPYPVVDLTRYTGRVDLEINARMSDPKAVSKELARYGLALEQRVMPLDVMIIRDRPVNPN